jgi:hypothetical protein
MFTDGQEEYTAFIFRLKIYAKRGKNFTNVGRESERALSEPKGGWRATKESEVLESTVFQVERQREIMALVESLDKGVVPVLN